MEHTDPDSTGRAGNRQPAGGGLGLGRLELGQSPRLEQGEAAGSGAFGSFWERWKWDQERRNPGDIPVPLPAAHLQAGTGGVGFLLGLLGWPWDTCSVFSRDAELVFHVSPGCWPVPVPLPHSRDPGPLWPGFGVGDPGALEPPRAATTPAGKSWQRRKAGNGFRKRENRWIWARLFFFPALRGAACRFLGFLLRFRRQGAAGSPRPSQPGIKFPLECGTLVLGSRGARIGLLGFFCARNVVAAPCPGPWEGWWLWPLSSCHIPADFREFFTQTHPSCGFLCCFPCPSLAPGIFLWVGGALYLPGAVPAPRGSEGRH